MKTQNTLENKARFFAQYWWQEVFLLNSNKYRITKSRFNAETLKQECSLELKPLSHISDEDAIEVSKIFGLGHLSGAIKELILSIFRTSINDSGTTSSTNGIKNWLHVFDYLRSKGYALPYMGLSVS